MKTENKTQAEKIKESIDFFETIENDLRNEIEIIHKLLIIKNTNEYLKTIKIDDVDFSLPDEQNFMNHDVRIKNALAHDYWITKGKINTLYDLVYYENSLLEIRNLGYKSLYSIEKTLAEMSLKLKVTPSDILNYYKNNEQKVNNFVQQKILNER